MEEHRLKEMQPYDRAKFENLYKSMVPLKKKLASNISHERLGLTYEDLLSYFDVKILFVFQKYSSFEYNKLQAHTIKALQFFKYRIIREIYKDKHTVTHLDINDQNEFEYSEDLVDTELEDSRAYQLDTVVDFITIRLSPPARLVFITELNPPAYITSKLQQSGRKTFNNIPAALVSEYLGWGLSHSSINRVSELRKEIRVQIQKAREHFKKPKKN